MWGYLQDQREREREYATQLTKHQIHLPRPTKNMLYEEGRGTHTHREKEGKKRKK